MKSLNSFLLLLIILLKAMKSNIIMVKIKGTGTQKFINSNCPDEVYYLNGTKIGNNICQTKFEKEENTILLKWYNQISGYQRFKGLNAIIEINFLNCSMSADMHEIFLGCSSLQSINFTGLHVVSANGADTMYNAFKNCISLTSLDLSMVFHLKRDFRYIFDNCKNLEYINFVTYDESKVLYGWYLSFDSIVPSNLVICVNETLAPNLKSFLSTRACTIIYCGKDWREKQKKIIKDSNTCIETCQNTGGYKYEYNNKCYSQCPEGLLEQNNKCLDKEIVQIETTSEIKKSTFIEISTEGKYFESSNLISTQNNFEDKISNIIINESKYFNNESHLVHDEIIIAKDKKISELKENIMNGDLDDILKNITDNKEDFIQKDEDNTMLQITTTENQRSNPNTNISTINFGTCESKLKKVYQINETLPLIIFKVDYFSSDLLIPIVGYEVYHPINKSKLDLSYCEDILVELNIPVSINEDNLFKYDPESDYYTDKCFSYTTENGTDIILSDRQQEFKDNNLSLCENKCNYIGYNQTNKQSTCNCTIKNKIDLISEVIDNPDKLSNNFNSSESLSSATNIIIMKCAKNLFTKEGIKYNISSYILIFIITFYIFSILIFIKCGFPLIKKDIEQIVKNKYNEEKNKKNKKIGAKRKKTCPINKKNQNRIFIHNFPPKRKIKLGNIHNNKSSNFRIRSNLNNNLSLNLVNNKMVSNINNDRIKNNNNNNKKITSNPKIKTKKIKESYNLFELNTLQYKQALNNEKRKFCEYYASLLKIKHPLIFAFCPIKDYNSRIIKINLFFLSFSIFYAINFGFFDEQILHKLYEDKGKYDIIYFLPKIFISFISGHFISIILNYIFLSERNVIKIKEQNDYSKADYTAQNVQKKLMIKYTIFFILGIIFLGFFWILLSSFGAVYQNTQILLVKNTLMSYAMEMVYPFFYNIFPSIFRMISISAKSEYIYNFSKFLQLL